MAGTAGKMSSELAEEAKVLFSMSSREHSSFLVATLSSPLVVVWLELVQNFVTIREDSGERVAGRAHE